MTMNRLIKFNSKPAGHDCRIDHKTASATKVSKLDLDHTISFFIQISFISPPQHRSGDRSGVWSWKLHDNSNVVRSRGHPLEALNAIRKLTSTDITVFYPFRFNYRTGRGNIFLTKKTGPEPNSTPLGVAYF